MMAIYNMCKTFNCLPSDIEMEDPVVMDVMMTIDRAIDSKQRNAQSIADFQNKLKSKK